MTKKEIKTVFFDAADTLFYINEGLGNTYAGVAKEFGADPSPDLIESAFAKHFRSAPPLAFGDLSAEEREDREKDWWRNVVREVFVEVGMFDRFDAYFDVLYEVFRDEAWILFPETKDVLTSLKEQGYQIGVISNFDSRVYEVCRDLRIMNYFDSFVISSEAGFAKPSPRIYRVALEEAGVDALECIHIGDSLRKDYYAAREAGIRSFLLDREGEYESRNNINTIEDLTEIIGILDRS